ncbi:hypothetical protein FISHEDRAFT_42747 [Fistulina hepatica ATCC 64428]|uniref:Glucosidase 2 subunit beta n=1 Tax=Fistulina hepatica ATCC 64428 TaxID=1128425 RepID=A0A0D7ADG0_9AGAR|nr:hypothetical protein FISHEDRAFT_42747 [Fistulina hepatica ATCC 64428]
MSRRLAFLVLPTLFAHPIDASPQQIRGVAPQDLSKYAPSAAGTWTCLDGSKEIPWSYVNDDSCDCADGSDEPGTSACPDNWFYCTNAGHIGTFIRSSRVDDGLCDKECCDGSDERPGLCPNTCKQMNAAYEELRAQELRTRKTVCASGSKIRSTYVTYAQKEKERLEPLVASLAADIVVHEAELQRLKDIADRAEALSQEELARKQSSPLYQALLEHSEALRSLRAAHDKHQARAQAFDYVLASLRTGYNPNYQDMAVLEAVRSYEGLAGLPHVGVEEDTAEVESEAAGETDKEDNKSAEAASESEEEWSPSEVDELLKTDYISLLLAHDEYANAPEDSSILFDFEEYLPDWLIPPFNFVRDLRTLQVPLVLCLYLVADINPASTDTSRARNAVNDAEKELKKEQKEYAARVEELEKLFAVDGFGSDGAWKKLDGTCIEKDTGDYTYELCFFSQTKQKPNKGGSSFNLGKFSNWEPAPGVEAGSPEYYTQQLYGGGAKCWNGPPRSTHVRMSCGTENVLVSIQELEKCEYEFVVTTPALCLPPEAADSSSIKKKNPSAKEEL